MPEIAIGIAIGIGIEKNRKELLQNVDKRHERGSGSSME